MGGKSETDQKRRPVATGEQLRLASLSLGTAHDEPDSNQIQRLIKKIIELTRCTQAQAELALFDNDNDLESAVVWILENPSQTWTEQKSKKEKKKEEEFKPVRGQSATRGRGQWSDRPNGGPGRGRPAPQGNPSGFVSSTRGTSRGASLSTRGRGGDALSQTRPVRSDFPKSENVDPIKDENNEWKSGPLVFKRSEDPVPVQSTSNVSVCSSAPVNSTPTPGLISFAAVAAAGANKEKQRQQGTAAPSNHEEPVASVSAQPESESEDIEEDREDVCVPSPVPEEITADESLPLSSSSPVNDSWTNQLKSDLGIGLGDPQPAVQFAGDAAATNSVPPQTFDFGVNTISLQTVEFVSDAAPSAAQMLPEYQFGYHHVEPSITTESPSVPAVVPVTTVQQPVPTEDIFSRTQVTASSSQSSAPVQAPKPVEQPEPTRHVSNGDFSVLKMSPPAGVSYGQPDRGLSYNISSVSYPPQDTRSSAPVPKPPQQGTPVQQHNQQQQNTPAPPSQHSQQQMQYPTAPQMPYGNYPYMNMYSPVTGVRADDPSYAAAALMQYPFGMGQIDLSTILPQGSLSGGQSQPSGQPQHRNDSHGLMDMNKYGQSGVNSSRDNNSVAPPPGFANPSPFVPQPNLQSLFMPQQYPPHPFSFMMPSVGGRQMYGGGSGDDDRNKGGYDNKMKSGGGQAQATPPPHYHNNGYLGGLGQKQPKQNPQSYGHGGWNN